MWVEISSMNKTEGYLFYYEDVVKWDRCETTSEVYKTALASFGRCISKMYIDTDAAEGERNKKPEEDKPKHIGWVFEKKTKYEDVDEYYIEETWATPLLDYRDERIREYAL